MRPLILALLALVPAHTALHAADLRHSGHVLRRVERFLGKRHAPLEPRAAAHPQAPRPDNTGLRSLTPGTPAGQPDTFLAHHNALNRWHAIGRGEDELWQDYQKREAEYTADYTARFGREATAAASARAVGANTAHATVIAPPAPPASRNKRQRTHGTDP